MATHAVVWIDHREAKVFNLRQAPADEWTVAAPVHIHRHSKGPGVAVEHPDDAKHYFDDVVKALAGMDQVLLTGPSSAKVELERYIREHHRTFAPAICGVETLDHPTDGQLVAHARKYFKRIARLQEI